LPITIKDIAKKAGVSHTTVSRALNNNPVISPQTRKRIQKLAQQMGYTPNTVAQSLLTRRTGTVGMVVTTIADPFIVRVVEGVEEIAQQAGYSIFLATSHNNPAREMEVVKTLHRRRVDAIIVAASRVGELYASQLDQIQVPIVLINNQGEGKYLYSVTIDDNLGARLAVEHLLDLGHRRIAYISTANRPKSSQQRLISYQTTLHAVGIIPDPKLVITPTVRGDFYRGQTSLEPLLRAGATGVFCYNDLTAIGLLVACAQQGVAVPNRLSVIGYDDIQESLYVSPQLTTIRQPSFRLGELAMGMVLDLLDDKQVQDQMMFGELVVRASTAPPQIVKEQKKEFVI